MHHYEGIGGVGDHRLKDFSRMAERFVHTALANRADLNQVLLGVEKNDAQAFAVEKTHLGTKFGDCFRTVDGERLALLS